MSFLDFDHDGTAEVWEKAVAFGLASDYLITNRYARDMGALAQEIAQVCDARGEVIAELQDENAALRRQLQDREAAYARLEQQVATNSKAAADSSSADKGASPFEAFYARYVADIDAAVAAGMDRCRKAYRTCNDLDELGEDFDKEEAKLDAIFEKASDALDDLKDKEDDRLFNEYDEYTDKLNEYLCASADRFNELYESYL